MVMLAKDVMESNFKTLSPGTTIIEATRTFKKVSEDNGRKVFGMMVTDDNNRLVGMISMYDILLLLRPKHIHIWGEMSDIEVSGYLEKTCRRVRPMLVGDVMTTEVITVTPDTHILMVLDIMIKKHVRRVPVVEAGKIQGVVYISDIFYHLMDYIGKG
jgi:CBS domain-containing protein